MILRLAVTLFDIGFYHKSLHETSELRRILSGVHDFLGDPQLLLILLRRVAVIRIHHDRRVHEILLHIEIIQQLQILIVVVRHDLAMLRLGATQDRMGIWISVRLHLPLTEDEIMGMLSRIDRVQHDAEVTGGRILHTGRYIDAGRHEAVLLVLHRTCADSHIAHDITEVAQIIRIQHLIRGTEAGLAEYLHVQAADRADPGEHIGPLLRVRLMQHALIALTRRTWLVRIDTWHDHDLILHLVRNLLQAIAVLEYRIRMICRTWSDN